MTTEARYITVYDKENNIIAKFSNTVGSLSEHAAVNLMVNPTINIVSNGESTLSFEMLVSSEKWEQIKNPENIYECNGRYYTALNEGSIVYIGDTVQVTLVETWYLLKRRYAQVYNVDPQIEALDEHTVKILPRTNEQELTQLMQYGGNVDLVHRKRIDIDSSNIDIVHGWGMEDAQIGDFMTVASQTFTDDRNGAAIVVTPILSDGTLLTQAELKSQVNSIINSTRNTEYVAHDNKGIIMGVFAGSSPEKNLADSETFCVRVHNLHAMSFTLTINGVKYEDSEVKDSRGVLMPRGSAGYALWGLLKSTDWSLGVCDVLPDGFDAANDYGTCNVESDMKDILENIKLVQSLYGGILDWDSKNKILNLRDEKKDSDFNRWKGVVFRREKNLSEPPEITWDCNLITRAYPLGNGNLNIKRVNGDKSYIDNFSYTHAIYEGYIRNPNIYDTDDEGGQKTLLAWAQRELEKLSKPRKTIKYSVIDLSGTEKYRHEKFDVNDIVLAYYVDSKGVTRKEYIRIQSITNYNYFFPSTDSSIEVGDKVANEVEIFYQLYRGMKHDSPTDSNGHLAGEDVFVHTDDDEGEYYEDVGATFKRYKNKTAEAIAGLELYVNNNFASTELFAQYKTEVDGKITASEASLKQYADGKYATQEMLTSYKSEVSGKISSAITESEASLKQYADGKYATQEMLTTYKSEVSDDISSAITSSEASLKQYADGKYATQEALTSYDSTVNGKITASETSLKQYADGKYATQTLLTQYQNNTNNSIASINQTASKQGAAIDLVVAKDYYGNYTGANAAAICLAINEQGSNAYISADHITMTGTTTFVSASDLATPGMTTINGGNISTETISSSTLKRTADSASIDMASNTQVSGTLAVTNSTTSNKAQLYLDSNPYSSYKDALVISATNGIFLYPEGVSNPQSRAVYVCGKRLLNEDDLSGLSTQAVFG